MVYGFSRTVISFALLLVCGLSLQAEGIVSEEYGRDGVASSFVAGKEWLPFPEYSDRDGWSVLFKTDSADMVQRGEKYLDYEWKFIPATAYLAFERTGDRKPMESIEGANRGALISLMLAELAEGKGRFIDQLANGAWHAAQQPSWVLAAHLPAQRTGRTLPDEREQLIDLGSGRYGAIVSLIWYFFHEEFDRINPTISYALKASIKRNILDSYLDPEEHTANWWIGYNGGMLNNWTPWCTADVILSFLLVEDDQERLDSALRQSVMSMDLFLDYIQEDGACEEGPGYWGAAAGKTYEYLQILHDASGGRFDLFGNDRIRRMGEYPSRSFIGDGYVVNFADASARNSNPAELIWNFGNAVGSREMTDFAMYLLADTKNCRFRYPSLILNDGYRALYTIRSGIRMRELADSLNSAVADGGGDAAAFGKVMASLRKDVPASTWYPETEHCFIRNSSGWFLGAKGGYNDESHNHNDVGTFILYIRNTPVFIDAGVGTYTKKTFSRTDRYTIWSMQCDWHSLPMINSCAQPYGRDYRSEDAECDISRGTFSVDIAGAYPEEAMCGSWVRSYRVALKGKPSVTVTDVFSLKERKAADVEHFLVKGKVLLPGDEHEGKQVAPGELLILCDGGLVVKMSYPASLTPGTDIMSLDDRAMTRVWGDSLTRINLTSSSDAPAEGKYKFVITELK